MRQAEVARLQTEAQAPQVAEAANALRGLRERNHFADAIRLSLEGGR